MQREETPLKLNTVMQGDSLQVLKTLPAQSVDVVFTSPPYMALRDYGVEGQIGLEASSELYLEKLVAVFDEAQRVLKDTGVCWVNLGDTFAGSGGAGGDYNDGGLKEGQPKWKQDTYRHLQADPTAHRRNNIKETELQQKCLMMIPERFAWKMIQHGWILRAKVVWFKPNGMIESSKDRPKLDYEMLYMFSKVQKYWFNYLEAKRPLKSVTVKRNKYAIKKMGRLDGTNSAKGGQGYVSFDSRPPIGGIRAVGENGNEVYSGNPWEPSPDGMAKIGSVWGLPPESIWSIAPKTFGHEFCETCDKLVKSRDLMFKCKDCQAVYGKLNPSEVLKANNLDPETVCIACGRTLKRHLTLNGKGRIEGLQPEVIDCGYFDLPDLQVQGCPKCKSNRRDLVCPTCTNKVHMHFAMFPEELVSPALRMTCPDQVCVKCGKPRFPIYTPTEEYAKMLGQGWHDHSDDAQAGMQQSKTEKCSLCDGTGKDEDEDPDGNWHETTCFACRGTGKVSTSGIKNIKADYRIKGWTDCGCGAGFKPGVMMDVFAGFNTVGAVAMKNGRDFIGIELDPRNVRAGMKRVEEMQVSSKSKIKVGLNQARLL